MRITKKLLRSIRTRLDERINGTFKLTNEELVAFLKTMWSNLEPKVEDREENIRTVLKLSLTEFIPDSLIL